MFCDGGRTSLQEHFSRVFEAAKFQTVTRWLTLVYDEDSAMKLDQEKQKQMLFFAGCGEPNGYMSVAQVETVVMKGVVEQPSVGLRKNKHHAGTSSGTALSNVQLTPLSERWAVPHHIKQQMLKTGVACRDDAGDEVVNPEAMSKLLVEELLFRSKAVLFVHLTAKDDLCALAAIESKVPYVAIADSEQHAACLQRHLEEEVFKMFLDEKSRFYKSDLAKSLKQKPASKKRATPEVGDGGDASVPKSKAVAPKSEAKAAAKKAASKKAASKKAKATPKPKAETKTKKKKASKKGDEEKSPESEEADEMDEEEEEEEEEPEDEED
jgi:hypothetical protein